MSWSIRRFIGLFCAGALVWLGFRMGLDWAFAFLVLVLLVAIVAFLDEISPLHQPSGPKEFFDLRPADGVVPLAPLPGAMGTANTFRPAIQAFRSVTPTDGACRSVNVRRPLIGRIGIFSLFVGRDGNRWDDRDIAEAYEALERMGLWLEREATRWQIPLNLERISTYFVADDAVEDAVEITESHDSFETVLDERNAEEKGVASASRAAAQLGFEDLAHLISQIDPCIGHDASIWVIHFFRSGRSCAITADQFNFPGVGVALCFARESAYPEPLFGLPYVDPVTLIHESLHLFGASDKYGTSLKSFPPHSVTSRDVMRLDKTKLSRLRIDPLTASELGWMSSPWKGLTKNEKRPAPT